MWYSIQALEKRLREGPAEGTGSREAEGNGRREADGKVSRGRRGCTGREGARILKTIQRD